MIQEVQIIKRFTNRTEYQVIREWMSVRETDVTDLTAGKCIIPAAVLGKMSSDECNFLVAWTKQWKNQLLVFSPFRTVNVKEKLQLPVDLTISQINKSLYEKLPVREFFLINLKPKLQLSSGQIVAVDVFYHSGSGQVTLTTLPVLDYQLLNYEEKCKEIFMSLLSIRETQADEVGKQPESELTALHQQLIVLAAAEITSTQSIRRVLKKRLQISIAEEKIKVIQEQLQAENYIDVDGAVTVKGQTVIEQSGFRAFVRELRKSTALEGAW